MQNRLNSGMEKNLAHRLRDARKMRGLTQVQLSNSSGIKQSDVSKIERGETLRPTGLIALARVLNVSPHWLDTGEGEMLPSRDTPEVRFTLPSDGDVIEVAHALHALDEHLQGLAPVLQDAGRDILRKWLASTATVDDAVQALEAMAMTSKAMNKKD
jgi:transcriptional regulator with XRE-family HTH domain